MSRRGWIQFTRRTSRKSRCALEGRRCFLEPLPARRRHRPRLTFIEVLERRDLLTGAEELTELGISAELVDPSSYYDVDYYDSEQTAAGLGDAITSEYSDATESIPDSITSGMDAQIGNTSGADQVSSEYAEAVDEALSQTDVVSSSSDVSSSQSSGGQVSSGVTTDTLGQLVDYTNPGGPETSEEEGSSGGEATQDEFKLYLDEALERLDADPEEPPPDFTAENWTSENNDEAEPWLYLALAFAGFEIESDETQSGDQSSEESGVDSHQDTESNEGDPSNVTGAASFVSWLVAGGFASDKMVSASETSGQEDDSDADTSAPPPASTSTTSATTSSGTGGPIAPSLPDPYAG